MVINITEWKDVVYYEGLYKVSELGEIINCKTGKTLKQNLGSNKFYMMVYLLDANMKRKSYLVHRIVAEAFVPNPNKLRQVNHKDENKLNNKANNLEWCTAKQNANHGTRNHKIRKSGYPVCEYKLDGSLIRIWKSATYISENYNVSARTIHDSLYGKTKHCRNRMFKKYSETHGENIQPLNLSSLNSYQLRLMKANKFPDDINIGTEYLYNPDKLKIHINKILYYYYLKNSNNDISNLEMVSLDNIYHNSINIK